MVPRKKFLSLSKLSGTLTPVEFNDNLKSWCNGKVESYLCFPKGTTSTRFRLVTKEEFHKLSQMSQYQKTEADGIGLLYGTTETGAPCESPYPVISFWLKDPHCLHAKADLISYRLVELIRQIYGKGYGSRSPGSSQGDNLYLGTRESEMSSSNPIQGPGQAQNSQYHWEHYRQIVLRAQIEKMVKK